MRRLTSGSDQKVAIVDYDRILIAAKSSEPERHWNRMGSQPEAVHKALGPPDEQMKRRLDAFLRTATKSRYANATAVR